MKEITVGMKKLTIRTNLIPVIDIYGNKVHEIVLPEVITPNVLCRGGFSDTGVYYKGSGIIYQAHMVNEVSENIKIIRQSGITYQKYVAIYPNLVGKYGIFQFPHQPIFSDYEGGCGKKEKKLIQNMKVFQFSAISELVGIYDTGIKEHKIYAYRLKDTKTSSNDVIKLFEYILQEDYNSAWDKNLWSDVTGYCYVRDLADWFVSGEFRHKLGTIYAMLNSIYTLDRYLYTLVINELVGLQNMEKCFLLYNSALVVRRFCPELVYRLGYDLDNLSPQLYAVLLSELYSGTACCHLENPEKWNWVKDEYLKKIRRQTIGFAKRVSLLQMHAAEFN